MRRISFYISIILLFVFSVASWQKEISSPKNELVFSVLNIGQGDALYIKAPNGVEVLVDAGPDKTVISELQRIMRMFDRHIDMFVITNPDKDHIGGFIPLLDRYSTSIILEPGTISKTETYKILEQKILDKKIERKIVKGGESYILDKNNEVVLTILYPDEDVSGLSTNDGSIVAKLTYKNSSILLQGDAPQKVEKHLLGVYKDNIDELDTDILKIGHHGSYTSTALEYVEAVSPNLAVISLGAKNSYGHPHKETLRILESQNVPILRTDLDGRITLISDGENWVKK